MPTAKDLHIAPIKAADANALVRRLHYSGKVVNNSQLHLGAFLDGRLEGAMQFGPSLDKRKLQGLVKDTPWNGFIELNRMAFSDRLPRNSESRALGVAFRMMRSRYPHIQWVVSFADAAQCGDGAIYRASGFVLTAIKRNGQLFQLPDGEIHAKASFMDGANGGGLLKRKYGFREGEGDSRFIRRIGAVPLPGFQLRYVYFIDPTARDRLTVPIVAFNKIDEMGAGMYRGERRDKQAMAGDQPEQRQCSADRHAPSV